MKKVSSYKKRPITDYELKFGYHRLTYMKGDGTGYYVDYSLKTGIKKALKGLKDYIRRQEKKNEI